MPTTYSYPGVYVEEIKPLSRPIAGVSTSTAGFIGIAEDLTDMPETPKSTEDKNAEKHRRQKGSLRDTPSEEAAASHELGGLPSELRKCWRQEQILGSGRLQLL
jgi:phage tail sheath protein FI